MIVVYWQASIVASITAAFWLGRWFRSVGRVRPNWWTPVLVLFWIVWTLSNVFTPQLLVVQLVVTAGAFLVNARLAHQLDTRRAESRRADVASERARDEASRAAMLEERITSLELELSEKERELLARVPKDAWRFLATEEEHRAALREQVDRASTRLLITSGWMNDAVVNHAFIGRLRSALERGVSVLIVFGYSSKKDRKPLDPRARRALQALVDLAAEHPSPSAGSLVIAHAPVHAKVVVRDRDVALVGSSNWLSNNNYLNAERTIEVRFPEFVDVIAESTARTAHGAEAGVLGRLLSGEAA